MDMRRAGAWFWAFVCVAIIGVVAAWGAPGLERGDVDPLSAVIALAGLAVAVWSGLMSFRGLRHQESDAVAMASQLARAVLRAETGARVQLLGGDGMAIDVPFVFRPGAARNAAGAAVEGRLSEVVSYYRRLRPGRLVITGAPGAGKTVLALELLLALLEERQPEDPVPVRVPLASWDTLPVLDPGTGTSTGGETALGPDEAVQVVRAWVCRHLVRTYRTRPAAAAALMDAGLILPVLDGLDEMDAGDMPGYGSRARQALDVLNVFQHGRAKAGLVLTCRSGEYQALEALDVWAQDAARVEIGQVTPTQAGVFIQGRVGNTSRWLDVLDALDQAPSSPLAQALTTPWRLTVAVTVYEQRHYTGAYLHSPRDLLDPSLATDRAVRDHLLGLYLQDATARHRTPRGGVYAPAQVRAWLGVLAAYLNTNAVTGRTVASRTLSGTDLVLHELWPLAGSRRPRITYFAFLAALLLTTTTLFLWTLGAELAGSNAFDAALTAAVILAVAFWLADSRLLQEWRETPWFVPAALAPAWRTSRQPRSTLAPFSSLGAFEVVLAVMFSDRDPRALVRADIVPALLLGLVFGALTGLSFGPQWGHSTVLGFAIGLTVGAVTLGDAGARYVALLLCTRRGPQALPWRLDRFLRWATDAGLVRRAGIAYQFRHRELQDWLADPANHP
ncbi:NACHT domain-containing protein [Streptomyces sp. NPDC003362]